MGDLIREWAAAHGVDVAEPARVAAAGADPRDDPCIDFGRLERRVPAVVLRPRDTPQLAATLRLLAEQRIPYKLRGRAHSSGGQVLIEGGAVVDLGGLDRIVDDDPDRELVTVEGGASWLQLAEALHARGRRPRRGLIDHLRTSVAGTLAVGGFADGSHIGGLLAASVRAITFVTASGDIERLTPDDELFAYVPCGRGQLGAIADVTLETERRAPRLAARLLRWYGIAELVRDAMAIAAGRLYDYMRVRAVWDPGGRQPRFDATAGTFCDELPRRDPALAAIAPSLASNLELVDLLGELRRDSLEAWDWSTAALEIVWPVPDVVELWPEINARIVASGVLAHVRRGVGMLVVPSLPRLPLAPLPASPAGLVLALRPRASRAEALALVPALRELATWGLARGAKLYLMGVEQLAADQLALQWGAALPRLRALKVELDPHGVCNPGLL
ncbi:MAG: FAD-binding oxidoreductase [Acidobacteriota bacterium]